MNIKDVLKFRFSYWESVLDRRHRVMYLQPVLLDLRDLEHVLTNAKNPVMDAITQHVKAYMVEGKEPPAAIAGPVMNIIDDIASGRTPVLRTGDYIAFHNFTQAKH